MLAYILAIAVGLGSFALYMAAFFFPEVHRKHDFVWSGVGMFYALVLWVCAGRITGGVLLGQLASVVLLGWFSWQTLVLRRELTPAISRTQPSTQLSGRSPLNWISAPSQPSGQPWWSGMMSLPSKAIAAATTAIALLRATWEASRQSMQKPAKPSRPTIVRSPKGTKKPRPEGKPPIVRSPLEQPQESETANRNGAEVIQGNTEATNLANPALERSEDDFAEDDFAEDEEIAPSPAVSPTPDDAIMPRATADDPTQDSHD